MTKLDYLFSIYECDNIEILKLRCPINIKAIDLYSEANEDFKDYVKGIELAENIEIYEIIKDRI